MSCCPLSTFFPSLYVSFKHHQSRIPCIRFHPIFIAPVLQIVYIIYYLLLIGEDKLVTTSSPVAIIKDVWDFIYIEENENKSKNWTLGNTVNDFPQQSLEVFQLNKLFPTWHIAFSQFQQFLSHTETSEFLEKVGIWDRFENLRQKLSKELQGFGRQLCHCVCTV